MFNHFHIARLDKLFINVIWYFCFAILTLTQLLASKADLSSAKILTVSSIIARN